MKSAKKVKELSTIAPLESEPESREFLKNGLSSTAFIVSCFSGISYLVASNFEQAYLSFLGYIGTNQLFLTGVIWYTVFLLVLIALSLLNHLIGVLRKILNGEDWKSWFQEWSKSPPKRVRTTKDLDDHLIGTRPTLLARSTFTTPIMVVLKKFENGIEPVGGRAKKPTFSEWWSSFSFR